MNLARNIGIFACVCSVIGVGTEAYGLDLQSEIDPLVQPLIDDKVVVGLVIGIVKDGQTQVIAYGETTKGSGKKPDGKTVYEIGSATKAFTGVLLADAVEAGRVKLDDPAQNFLPDGVTMPVADGKPIALEHLATHTSGLPRLPDNLAPKDALNPYADYTADMMYDFLNGHKLRRPPGEYEYSNYGIGLLGSLLARAEGKSYEGLLIERIAKPIGMADTSIKLNDGQRGRLAPPYDAALEPNKNWDIPTLAGAGALRSTADDMLKFLRANLADDDRPVTKALRLARAKRNLMKDGQAIGLGWHLARDSITWAHSGMTGGYASYMSVIPQRNIGVAILANTATAKVSELGNQVTRVAFGLPVKPPVARKTIEVDPKVLETYVGKYAIVPQFVLTVTLEDGKLWVQATAQKKFQVFPESKTKFFYKVVDAQITFVVGDDGKVKQLVLHQNGLDQPAARQE